MSQHDINKTLREIENLLVQHSDVLEAVVIHRKEFSGLQRIVAYIVSDLIPDRLPYQSVCQIELEQQTVTLQTEDISFNGFCVEGELPFSFKKGQIIRLRLLLPGETEESCLKGRLIWHQEHKIGIQLELTSKEQNWMHQSVDYLLEKQGFLKVLQRIITGRLRKYLTPQIPFEMMPKAFIILQALPLTPDGQINHQALPPPEKTSWLEMGNP